MALVSCCLPTSSTMSTGDLIQMRVKYADSSKVIKGVSRTGTTVRQLLGMAGVAEDVALDRVRELIQQTRFRPEFWLEKWILSTTFSFRSNMS